MSTVRPFKVTGYRLLDKRGCVAADTSADLGRYATQEAARVAARLAVRLGYVEEAEATTAHESPAPGCAFHYDTSAEEAGGGTDR